MEQVQTEMYNYKVKFINPKKKSDTVLITWHQVTSRFETISELKLKLKDDLSTFVPDSPDFRVGYMVNRTTQQLILAREDLAVMYSTARDEKEIILWCDKKNEAEREQPARNARKRNSTTTPPEAGSSKVLKGSDDDEMIQILDKLKKKHLECYTYPQLRLWAKFIHMKRHEDYDEPPNIPLITGSTSKATRKGSKRESVGEAVADAATAIVSALKGSPKITNAAVMVPTSKAYSPNNHANLRRKHLEDLRTLHGLYEDSVLTDLEYTEQKRRILSSLRDL